MKQDGARLRVRRWSEYQHYKDRRPPWIKLHVQLLDDYEFTRLPDASKWLAVGSMLLAAKTDNHIPSDPEWIARALHLASHPDLGSLLSSGFLETCDCKRCASGTLATREQSAMPETESDAESEAETHTEARAREAGGGEPVREAESDISAQQAAAERFEREYPEQGWIKVYEIQRAFHDLWRQGAIDPEPFFANLAAWKRSPKWRQDGGRYIPGAEKWLGSGSYLKAPPTPISHRPPVVKAGPTAEEIAAMDPAARDAYFESLESPAWRAEQARQVTT